MSVYHPAHEPATWWERALQHPQTWLLMWSIVVAVQLLLDPWLPTYTPSLSLGEIPLWTATGLSAALCMGGVLGLVGVLNDWDNRSRAWAVEKAGWWVIAAGWSAYAFVVITEYPGSTIAWGSSFVFSAIGITRILALWLEERRTKRIRRKVETIITDEVLEVNPDDE